MKRVVSPLRVVLELSKCKVEEGEVTARQDLNPTPKRQKKSKLPAAQQPKATLAGGAQESHRHRGRWRKTRASAVAVRRTSRRSAPRGRLRPRRQPRERWRTSQTSVCGSRSSAIGGLSSDLDTWIQSSGSPASRSLASSQSSLTATLGRSSPRSRRQRRTQRRRARLWRRRPRRRLRCAWVTPRSPASTTPADGCGRSRSPRW